MTGIARGEAARHSRAILSTSTLLMGRQIVVASSGAVATAVLAHALRSSDFGVYSGALATFYLASSACDLGFTTILARELATRPQDRAQLLRAGLRAASAWAALIACGFLAITFASGWGTSRMLCLAALTPALAGAGLSVARTVFVVTYDMRRIALVDVACNFAQCGVLVVLALLDAPIPLLAATVAASFLVNSAVVMMLARAKVGPGVATTQSTVAMVRMAAPFGLASFLASAYFTVDLVVAGFVLPDAAVGNYAAAVKLLTLVTMLPTLLMSVALPGMAAVDAGGDRDETNALLVRLWRFQLVVVGALCWGIFCFARPVIDIFFGSGYAAAVVPLRLLMLSGIVAIVSNLVGALLVSRRRGPAMFAQNAVALAANVLLNLWLLPRYGINAAAWLTLATEVFVCSCGAALVGRGVAWRRLLQAGLRPLVALAGFGFAAAIPLATPVRICLATAVLATLLTGLRTWPEELRELIQRAVPVRVAGRARLLVRSGVKP